MFFNASRVIISALIILGINDRPDLYYVALRWLVTGSAGYGLYLAGERGLSMWATVFGVIALMFNPLFPVFLDRSAWSLVLIATTTTMMVSISAVPGEQPSHEPSPADAESSVIRFHPHKRI